MRIKTFYSFSNSKLDREVNEFLDRPDIEVVDVQFGPTAFYFAVMVQFREAASG